MEQLSLPYHTTRAAASDPSSPAAVLAKHGRSFHFASRLLDAATAQRCARLYRFCRHIDDIADESADQTAALERLDRTYEMLTGQSGCDLITADFLDLARSCDMDTRPALELIRGVSSDLGNVRIADEVELHRYCYRVAGTVGLLMCGVLGVRDPSAYPFAIDLGIAMQLTNIARDVTEDARRSRRYLPASLLGEVEPERMARPDPGLQKRLALAVDWILTEADRYYASGEQGLVYLPSGARLGIRVAARVYRQIGVRLRQRGCATWDGRVVVPGWQKASVALLAICREPPVYLRGLPERHDWRLHRSLAGMSGADRFAGVEYC
jgi:phytoene synthase